MHSTVVYASIRNCILKIINETQSNLLPLRLSLFFSLFLLEVMLVSVSHVLFISIFELCIRSQIYL